MNSLVSIYPPKVNLYKDMKYMYNYKLHELYHLPVHPENTVQARLLIKSDFVCEHRFTTHCIIEEALYSGGQQIDRLCS